MHRLSFLSILAGFGCSPPVPSSADESPGPRVEDQGARHRDILFIVLDTVRSDRLGTYGGPHPTSPALSRLSKSGVLFEDVTSVASWTWPSHASLFTGTPPWVHGAHFAHPEEGAMQMGSDPFHASQMREDIPTLSQRLSDAGYQTHALSANRLISADFGLTRGFEQSRFFDTDEDVERAAAHLLAQSSDEPLFLFINLYGAHAPLEIQSVPWLQDRPELVTETAPIWLKPFLRKEDTRIQMMRSPAAGEPIGAFSYMTGDLIIPPEGQELLRDVYDGELRAVDYFMGQIITAWKESRGEDQIIAVTSDHGEMLGERQLLEHGRTVSPELIQVPLVVSAPGLWPSGTRVQSPVQPHHLMDSLLFFAGIEPKGGSLDRAVQGNPDPAPIQSAAWRDHFWAEEAGTRFDQGYRYYREGSEAVIFGTNTGLEYYQLDVDPHLILNRVADFPDRASALHTTGALAFPEGKPTPDVTPSMDAIDHLQALGYIEAHVEEE